MENGMKQYVIWRRQRNETPEWMFCRRTEEEDHVGGRAQLVERVLSMHEALGSTPSNSIFFISHSPTVICPSALHNKAPGVKILLNRKAG